MTNEMNEELYLMPFLLSLAFSIFFCLLAILAAKIKRPDDIRLQLRHIHRQGVSRFGGVAIIFAFVITLLFDKNLYVTRSMWGFFCALLLIVVIGVWDDIRELKWKKQLFFQVCLLGIIFIFGIRLEYITNPFGGLIYLNSGLGFFLSLIFVGGWIITLVNAMNWVDGADGISGGIAMIGAITIFILSLNPDVNQPPVAIMAMALMGSILGFLLLNFNPARLMAGTTGSTFFGFSLAVLSIFAGTKIATTLLVMAVPLIDAFWVIRQRVKEGESIFQADNRHLHHKLLNLGWSTRQICLFYYATTIVVSIIALNTRAAGKSVAFVILVVFLVGILILVEKKRNKEI